jgi:hypothetical protein
MPDFYIESVRLEDVDRSPHVGWVAQESRKRATIEQVLGIRPAQEAASDERFKNNLLMLRNEIEETARSVRHRRSPETVLHALLLKDNQTVGQISAMVHRDPRDLELALDALISLSLVRVDKTKHLERYSLASQLDS